MKPWYYRKRYWSVAILLLLVYFCFVPSPLKISPETTGYTEPLTPDGYVDYFGAYEKTYLEKLKAPEDNGQRLLIVACGPRILEQNGLMDAVPWEKLPTDPQSKEWFENRWTPFCDHMSIDPFAKPKFLDNHEFFGFMGKRWKTEKKEERLSNESQDELQKLWDKLVTAPWKAEEHPNAAEWIRERSPVLDLFGVAVRKPNFVCWRWREDSVIGILLPDVQANRAFARDLRVRVTERLGKGDVDGAWYDVMSMFYLSRKFYGNDPFNVTKLVGIAVEGLGWESAKIVLRDGKPTPEQLERFAKDLDSLSRKTSSFSWIEQAFAYSALQSLHSDRRAFFKDLEIKESPDWTDFFLGTENQSAKWLRLLAPLPFDLNIAGKRLTELNNAEFRATGDHAWNINSTLLKKNFEVFDSLDEKTRRNLERPSVWLRMPLIRTRSRLIADCVFVLCSPAMRYMQEAFDRSNSQLELLRLAVALERYKAAHEKYPETLEQLVPAFLEEVPLDPCTGRQTLVYKPEPSKTGRPFTLYSLGPDGKDDNGTPLGPKNENQAECDFVF